MLKDFIILIPNGFSRNFQSIFTIDITMLIVKYGIKLKLNNICTNHKGPYNKDRVNCIFTTIPSIKPSSKFGNIELKTLS